MLLPMQQPSDPESYPSSLFLLSQEGVEEDERWEELGLTAFEELFSAGWIF